MLVQVKDRGVKLAGKWCYYGDKADIDEEEYERNKDYVDIIDEEWKEKNKTPEIPNRNDLDEEDIKLQELRAKAKELGIRNCHLMGIERLEEEIKEKEAPLFGETNKNEETNEENNPIDDMQTQNNTNENDGEKSSEE